MPQLKELLTNDDCNQMWEESKEKPVLLFKQNTACPISAGAFSRFNAFLESTAEGIHAYFVKVRETREISNVIEEKTGVEHQSPQIILIKNNEVLWHTSHEEITEDSIDQALKSS